MNSIKKDTYFNITNAFFVLAILIFSITSLFHVTVFWLITNSLFLSVIMSVATGVGIISSLLSTKYTKLTYISFSLIILIELFGNIYGSFIHIDINSEYFKGWKELMEPVFALFYTVEEGEAIPDAIYKRWAAIIQGSFIPLLLSITFHMWMVVRDKYEKLKPKVNHYHDQIKSVEQPKEVKAENNVNQVKEVKKPKHVNEIGKKSASISFPFDLIKKKILNPKFLLKNLFPKNPFSFLKK
jgi:hypothetical protein